MVKTLKQTLQKINWLAIAQFAIVAFVAVAPIVIPRVADAQLVNEFVTRCPADTGVRCTEGNISQIFRLIISWALAIAFIAAVIMLIWGGFRYITSAGNDDQAKTARGTIVNALIGIVIIILSYIIVQIVWKFVAGTGGSGGAFGS